MKTIVVAGGTGQLGSVVVPRLTRDFRCVVPYRSAETWQRLVDTTSADGNLIGISHLEQSAEHGPFYALVHLAGGFASGNSVELFSQMLEMNLLSAVRAVEATLPHIENGGRIVAISAAASLSRPAGLGAYSSSKAAVNAFIETLAKDLKDRAITANALLPTTLDTPEMRKQMPTERLVKRTNVAEMIALLLSPQAASVTGQLIGMTA